MTSTSSTNPGLYFDGSDQYELDISELNLDEYGLDRLDLIG